MQNLYESTPPEIVEAYQQKELQEFFDFTAASEILQADEDEYVLFTEERERKEIALIGKKAAKYIKENDIGSLILIDRSARPAYIAVLEAWKLLYPEEKPPNIFFVNPKGLISLEQALKGEADALELLLDSISKADKMEDPKSVRTDAEIDVEFKKTFKRLLSLENKNVLLFDTCIHTGNSIRPVRQKLTENGLNIHIGMVNASNHNESDIEPELEVMNAEPARVCYPFHQDKMVEKTFRRSVAEPTESFVQVLIGRQVRKEIRRAVRENIGVSELEVKKNAIFSTLDRYLRGIAGKN